MAAKLKHEELCEPCGDCDWCRHRWALRTALKRLTRAADAAAGSLAIGFPLDTEQEKSDATYAAARRRLFKLESAISAARNTYRKG